MRIIPEITTKIKERFFRYVSKGDSCWEWMGCKRKTARPYGQFFITDKAFYAHRVSWTIHRSPIPAGLGVLHHCDNPSCVNPDHLFLGTNADNNLDMRSKGRSKNLTGESHGCSVLTWNEVREIRDKYIPKTYSTTRLAHEYGVSQPAIWRIIHRKTWIE